MEKRVKNAIFPQHPVITVEEESGVCQTNELYQFTWQGKQDAVLQAFTPTETILQVDIETSLNFESTQNMYIEGDNLDALKCLLPTHKGKIKAIYIDPPYNTGNNFVYCDDFSQFKTPSFSNAAFASNGEKEDIASSESLNFHLNRIAQNVQESARMHTGWLNMMYPRLLLAREMLTEDGAIFISIGDEEVANLTKICNEIFGERHFIANICHKHRASVSNDRIISENHNHVLFYAKDISTLFKHRKEIGGYPNLEGFTHEDERGKYKLTPLDGPGDARKGNPFYEFLGVKGYWRYNLATMQQKYDAGLIVKTKHRFKQKYYLHEALQSRKTLTTWWDDGFLTSSATKALNKLMGAKTFEHPKPVNLVQRCIAMLTATDKHAVVMDFFSGSATTAQAVMQLNAEDDGARRFILVQRPEAVAENSNAKQAGYSTICDIAKERIRRAGQQIQENSNASLDIGFRVYKAETKK